MVRLGIGALHNRLLLFAPGLVLFFQNPQLMHFRVQILSASALLLVSTLSEISYSQNPDVPPALPGGSAEAPATTAATEPDTDAEMTAALWIDKAKVELTRGNGEAALAAVNKAVEKEPTNPIPYIFRARLHSLAGRHELALADYSEAIQIDPEFSEAWQRRGEARFCLGKIDESIADFDQYIVLQPRQAPHHWQRGIALYYAGRYADGRKQFESHRLVNPNDVENAAWHFLCVARLDGPEKARKALIPVEGDPRVPMNEIHGMFAGRIKPEDVLKAARKPGATPEELEKRAFYAYLYIGLYYEAIGNDAKARENILKAARDFDAEHYMGEVARVHAARLQK